MQPSSNHQVNIMAKATKKTRTRKKYDWKKIKQDFMVSDFTEAKVYYEYIYGSWNGTASKAMRGWKEEKEVFHQSIYEQTMEKIKGDEVAKYSKVLKAVLDKLSDKIQKDANADHLSISELERLWNIFMTMNGKVTRVTESLNKNVEIKREELTEAEEKKLSEALEKNGLL